MSGTGAEPGRPGPSPSRALLGALAVTLSLWILALSLHPFELVDGFGEFWDRLVEGATRLEPERPSVHFWSLSLLGLTLGLWSASGARLFGLSLALAIPDLCLCIELGQAAFLGRHPRLGDLLLNIAVAWLAHALGRRLGAVPAVLEGLARSRRRIAAIAAAALLVLPLLGLFERSSGTALSGWDPGYKLLIGDEGSHDRPWSGRIARLSLWARALDRSEARSLEDGGDAGAGLRRQAELAYDLDMGLDPEVCRGPPLPLVDHHGRRSPRGGVELVDGAWLESSAPTAGLVSRLTMQDAFSVELRLATARRSQDGPARIVGLSADPWQRNFTLGQEGADLVFRVRTPWNGDNGARFEAEWPVFEDEGAELHLVAVYDRGRFRLFRDGDEVAPAQRLDVPGFELAPMTLQSPYGLVLLVLLPVGGLLQIALGGLRRGWRLPLEALCCLLPLAAAMLAQELWFEQRASPGMLPLALIFPPLGDLGWHWLVRAFCPGGRLASLTRFPEPPDDRPPPS